MMQAEFSGLYFFRRGFLHLKQIRNMVGTLLKIGPISVCSRADSEDTTEKDRHLAGP